MKSINFDRVSANSRSVTKMGKLALLRFCSACRLNHHPKRQIFTVGGFACARFAQDDEPRQFIYNQFAIYGFCFGECRRRPRAKKHFSSSSADLPAQQ